MGNWNITIQGVGQHHNADDPKDANVMADIFVHELRQAGQSITHASITYGSQETVTGSKVLNRKAAAEHDAEASA